MLNAYDTWLTRPNHDLTSVKLRGVGKSDMALRYFLHGRTVLLVISKPINSMGFVGVEGDPVRSTDVEPFGGLEVALFN